MRSMLKIRIGVELMPPMEAPNEQLVVAFVRANPGAIAYVSPETPLGAGVRAVRVRN